MGLVLPLQSVFLNILHYILPRYSKFAINPLTPLFISLRPYGDMPKELVWGKSFIGADKYNIKLERRNH